MIAKVTVKEMTPGRKVRSEGREDAHVRNQYFSRAVSKALEALVLLNAKQGPMSLNEIAHGVQLSKTSAFRLLRTLESVGYLVSSGWGQYALAPGTHSVVSPQFVSQLLRVASPHLQDLSRELHETISLAALFDNRVEVVAVVESSYAVRMTNVIGLILPPNASSLGKVVTAFQPDERREKLLRSYGTWRFTDNTIVDRNDLDREFARIRSQNFSVDREETVPDGICFGVPIRGESNEVTAAVSVSIPKTRLRDGKHEKAIVAGLTAVGERISADLRQAVGSRNTPPAETPAPGKRKAAARRPRRRA